MRYIKNKISKSKFAFTVIELLTVVSVLAILFVVIYIQTSNSINRAKLVGVQADFKSFYVASLSAIVDKPVSAIDTQEKFEDILNKHLSAELQFTDQICAKKDSWGTAYRYGYKFENNTAYVLFCSNATEGITKHYTIKAMDLADATNGAKTVDTPFKPRVTMGFSYNGSSLEDLTSSMYDELRNQAAKLTYETVTITIDADTGAFPQAGKQLVQEVVKGAMTTVLDELPVREGYTLIGFDLFKDSPTVSYAIDKNVITNLNADSNITLYAKYEARQSKVCLMGAGAPIYINAKYGSPLPKIAPPSATGKTFSGYYLGQGSTGTKYYDAAGNGTVDWDRYDDVTLYAGWILTTVKVTFDLDGGTLIEGSTSTDVNYGNPYTQFPAVKKTGFVLDGWMCSGNKIYPGSTCQELSDHTLVANWVKDSLTVTYNGNKAGAVVSRESDLLKLNQTYGNVAGEMPTADVSHYTFLGWYTAADGGVLVTKDTVISAGFPNTLYARWKPEYCKVEQGQDFSVYIDVEGGLYVSGANSYGQLGTGDTTAVAYDTKVNIESGSKPSKLIIGQHNVSFIDDSGNLWAAGSNASKHLGVEGTNVTKFTLIAGPSATNSGVTGTIQDAAFGNDVTVVVTSTKAAYLLGKDANSGKVFDTFTLVE